MAYLASVDLFISRVYAFASLCMQDVFEVLITGYRELLPVALTDLVSTALATMTSYPKPTEITYPYYESVNPRPLYPLSPPKVDVNHARPPLPTATAERTRAPYSESIIPGYTLSTHVGAFTYS